MDMKALEAAGFQPDDELKAAHEEQAANDGMDESGPYVIHGAWRKGLVTVFVEQNTVAESLDGGIEATIQHPSVCVVSGPKGKVACNAEDTELILAIVSGLS